MKFFLFVAIFISSHSHAQKSLSIEIFRANVRPVLSAIVLDFYQMLAHFEEFPKEITNIVSEVEFLHEQKTFIENKCPRYLNEECLDNILQLKKNLLGIHAKTLSLISHQKMTSDLHINSLSALRVSYDFMVELEVLKLTLDNSALIIKAKANQKKSTSRVVKQVDALSTFSSLMVIENIPLLYKEDFRHFYANFIRPIEQQNSAARGHRLLNRNITSLNYALNLLNQNLTKRNKKTPQGMGPYLLTIHNRWNSILRYYY